MKTIGITGTREGLTPAQKVRLASWLLQAYKKLYIHLIHGACRGVDRQAHDLALEAGFSIYAYPVDSGQRDWTAWAVKRQHPNVDWDPDLRFKGGYLERNHRITTEADVVLAFPAQMTEQKRGGTWHAVRSARRRKKPCFIIWPDGSWVKA